MASSTQRVHTLKEYTELRKKLKKVHMRFVDKPHCHGYIVIKDGNILGKKKANEYLAMRNRYMELHYAINSTYGVDTTYWAASMFDMYNKNSEALN